MLSEDLTSHSSTAVIVPKTYTANLPQHTHRDRSGLGLNRIYMRIIKRGLDVVAAAMLLPLAILILAVPILMTRKDGPVLFGHTRVGRNGLAFRCWKIRTMVPNADEVLRDHLRANPDAAREWLETRKLSDDPRVTRMGRFLRKTSLDELPQLVNVLRGEMSLVGPRPITSTELDLYDPLCRAGYLGMAPGITGLWQVKGRNRLTFAQRAEWDRHYAETAGFRQDLAILLRTVPVVLAGSGG